MSRWNESADYEERLETGSDVAFNALGGIYIDHKTSKFKPGHRDRVKVVGHALRSMDLSPAEIRASLDLGEGYIKEHVKQLQQIALSEQAELREQIGA